MMIRNLDVRPRRWTRDGALALRERAMRQARSGWKRPRPAGDAAEPLPVPQGPGPLPLSGAAALELPIPEGD